MDFVHDIMNYSPYGSASQAFIMTAIGVYAEAIINAPPKPDEHAGFFPMSLWRKIAKDIKQRHEAFIKRD